jgi:hypothetical protein
MNKFDHLYKQIVNEKNSFTPYVDKNLAVSKIIKILPQLEKDELLDLFYNLFEEDEPLGKRKDVINKITGVLQKLVKKNAEEDIQYIYDMYFED